MWPFKKKKPDTLRDKFSSPGSQSPKAIYQFGDFKTENVQFWIIYIKDDETILASGPFDFSDACIVARNRGLPFLFIRTSSDENYSLQTIMTAFQYKFAGEGVT